MITEKLLYSQGNVKYMFFVQVSDNPDDARLDHAYFEISELSKPT